MVLAIDHDTFDALGLELLRAAVADFQAAVAAHAFTVDVPAPQAHPMIERIVKQHQGQFSVLPADAPPLPASDVTMLQARIDTLETTINGKIDAAVERLDTIEGKV